MTPVETSPMTKLTAVTATSMMFIGSRSCSSATAHTDGGCSRSIALGPWLASRAAASAALRPDAASDESPATTSWPALGVGRDAGVLDNGHGPSLLEKDPARTLPRCRLGVNPRRWLFWRRRSSLAGSGGRSGRGRDEAFADLTVDRVHDSDELYLLSAHADTSVKFRDGLMDVKGLVAVDDDGLEQWVPLAKHPFPLARDDVARLLARAARRARRRSSGTPTRSRSLGAVAAADRRPARRSRCTSGAPATRSAAAWPRSARSPPSAVRRRTLAVESEDPAAVMAVLRDRGLATRANVCMARGLKTLAGFAARALRGDRRGHQLGQAPRRRAARRRHLEHGRRPRRRDPPGRGARRERRARAGADAAHAGGDRRAGRRGARGRRRRARGRRHRRAARRGERARSSSSAVEQRCGVADRDRSPARRRGASPTSRPGRGSACRAARWRSSTPAAAARSSPSATTPWSTSSSACPSARCA